MNDLFEQLKSEPAVNKYIREAPPTSPPKRLSQDKYEKSSNVDKKSDKSEKSPMKLFDNKEKSVKYDKHDKSPVKHFDKQEKSLRSDRNDKTPKKNDDKHEKSPTKSDNSEKSLIKDDRHEKSTKSNKHDKSKKSDQHDKSTKSHKDEKSTKSDKYEKSPTKSDRHEKSSRSDKHEKSPTKSERYEKSPAKTELKKSHKQSFGLDVAASVRRTSCSSPRRDSMPPPRSAIVFKNPANKSRSMSPPKLLIASGSIKPFKVLIERKKLEDLMAQQAKAVQLKKKMASKETKIIKITSSPSKLRNSVSIDLTKSSDSKLDKSPNRSLTSLTTTNTFKKITPTKAQQKLFDPAVLKQVQKLKPLAVKRCVVRLQRSNLKELQKNLAKLNKLKTTLSSPPKVGEKRKNNISSSETSPPNSAKKIRLAKESKTPSGFFIKLTSSPSSNRNKLLGNGEFNKKLSITKEKEKPTKKVDHSKPTFKPTKFTRTSLIKNFGKRFFRSRVKIERCSHPLMIIFESNARARKLQAKGNKSKNLSVSFKDQVEIFGDSDSDTDSSDDDSDPDFSIGGGASTSKAAQNKALAAAAAIAKPQPMPARLKKVENGKVIDDIEFDPSLFLDPRDAPSSTPFISPGRRRKQEKKSYSPLKGDGTPSPRKEQLKLANERLPPSGLRRLNIDDVDDEDDEDDDCEYIVPIDIPQRRGSRVNSTNIPTVATNGTIESPVPTSAVNVATHNDSNTTDSFASANELLPSTDVTIAMTTTAGGGETVNSNELPELQRISPAPSLNSLHDLVESVISSSADPKELAASPSKNNLDNIEPQNEFADIVDSSATALTEINEKLRVTLDEDMSLNLFVEDSENITAASNIVDSIVKETIDELSNDIEMTEAIADNTSMEY